MTYTVKVYNRKNAWAIDSQEFDNHQDAVDYYMQTGLGESYWSELRDSNGITLSSTVAVGGR